MNINFDLYRIFYITARANSISKAAKELYISQPAVSQAIKQLEERLGGRLFFRTPKGIVLTAEGEVVFKYIEQAYNFIMTAQTKFSEMHGLINGEIKIGASDTLCKYYLLPHIEAFHHNYPDIRIQITNRTTKETIELLESGKVDFGVINLPVEQNKHLQVIEGLSINECFVVGEKYRAIAEKSISINELANYPILLLEKGSNTRKCLDDYFERIGVKIVPEIELGSIDLLVEFARMGFGAAFVVKNFIEEELKNSKLYEIQLTEQLPHRKIGIVYLKNVPLSAAAKKFIERLI